MENNKKSVHYYCFKTVRKLEDKIERLEKQNERLKQEIELLKENCFYKGGSIHNRNL